MERTSLALAGVALVCGAALGLGGAVAFVRLRVPPDAEKMAPVAALPEARPKTPETHVADTAAEPLEPEPAALPAIREVTAHDPAIVVGVNGAVHAPGVYTFTENARVYDGIAAAGNVTDAADLTDINIAARLLDNTSLYIPFRMFRRRDRQSLVARRPFTAAATNPAHYTRSGWAHGRPLGYENDADDATVPSESDTPTAASKTPDVNTSNASGMIDLNQASLAELQDLPGIGPKTAESIDAYRQAQPFRSVEELTAVHGIGPKRLEAVQDLVTVQ